MHDYITTMPRDDQETDGRIRTFTGRYVNPLTLQPADICIEDIAHHLSNECRYAGACPEFYSVAQHCVLGVQNSLSLTAKEKLAFLLHDSAEAYFKDLPSPVKNDPRMKWYRDLEHEKTRLIFLLFRLDPWLLSQTKWLDDYMFRWEVVSWWGTEHGPRGKIRCWTPEEAEIMFLHTFHTLQGVIHGTSSSKA